LLKIFTYSGSCWSNNTIRKTWSLKSLVLLFRGRGVLKTDLWKFCVCYISANNIRNVGIVTEV
jgi:hypothetical protein